MRRRSFVLMVATVFAAFGAFAQDSSQQGGMSGTQSQGAKTAQMTPQQFLTKSAQVSQAEIKMGQLAQQRGTSPQVKDLGAKLVSDHENLYNQTKQVASSQNITVPSQPSQAQMQEYNRLASLSGTQFDRAFLQAQERDHMKAVRMYQKGAQSSNPQIAQLSQNAIPIMQQHEQMSKQALASLPGGTKGTPSTDQSGQYQQQK